MAAHSEGDHSKFLALPAELRTRIYELLFEDENEKDLDVFLVKSYLPAPAIMKVSHQVRKETIELFNQAIATFWRTHIFYIQPSNITNVTTQAHEPNYNYDCEYVPKISGIPKLTFRLVGLRLGPVPYDDDVVTCDIEFDVDPHGVFRPREEAVPLFLPRLVSPIEDGSTATKRWHHHFIGGLAWDLSIPAYEAYVKINDERVVSLNLRKCVKALVEVCVRGDNAGMPYKY